VSVYIWNDVSPDDGCTLVRFSLSATSLHEVVAAVRGVAGLQNTTAGHLLKRGGARKAGPEEAEAALAHPGVVLWLDGDAEDWRVLAKDR
jgi:hypothetical protein